MTLTFETYKEGTNYINYGWDKNNGYQVIEGSNYNGVISNITYHTYSTPKSAKTAFNRFVRRVKGE